MTRSLIIAGRETLQLGRGRGFKALIALSVVASASLAAAAGASRSVAGGAGSRVASSFGSLVFIASSLTAVLAASVSFAAEREGGGSGLVASCGVSRTAYVIGKFLGCAIFSAAAVLAVVLAISALAGRGEGPLPFVALAASALAAVFVYAAWGARLGLGRGSTLSAAGRALGFWLATTYVYEALGWALLPSLPYRLSGLFLAAFLAANPAEALRVGAIFLEGRGAIYGPEFYYWQRFFSSPMGLAAAVALLAAHVALPLGLAVAASRRDT